MDKTFAWGSACIVAVILAITLAVTVATIKNTETNREIARVCVSTGGSWAQNANKDFECRK